MHYLRVTTLTRWTWYLCLFWASWTNLVCSLWLYIFLSCSSHLLFFPAFFQAEDWAEISEVFLNSQTLSSRARREYVRLPRLLFICLFFPFLSQGMRKMAVKVECRFDWMRERAKRKRRPCILWSPMNYSSFSFSRVNHISIEPNYNTTGTRMYLLSVIVYYDPFVHRSLHSCKTCWSAAVIVLVLTSHDFQGFTGGGWWNL